MGGGGASMYIYIYIYTDVNLLLYLGRLILGSKIPGQILKRFRGPFSSAESYYSLIADTKTLVVPGPGFQGRCGSTAPTHMETWRGVPGDSPEIPSVVACRVWPIFTLCYAIVLPGR